LIEGTPANSSRNLHLCALCVSAVEFSDSLRPTSVVPNTHYRSQRHLLNPFAINPLHTLDGGCITPQWRCPHDSDPLEYLSHVPYLLYFQSRAHSFCTFLHSPKTQLFYFQAIPHSASKNTTTGGGGRGTSAIRKFEQFSWKFSAAKVGNFLSAPRHASHESQSPITSSRSPSICTRLQEC